MPSNKKQLRLPVSQAEKEQIENRASALGLLVSEYLRHCIAQDLQSAGQEFEGDIKQVGKYER